MAKRAQTTTPEPSIEAAPTPESVPGLADKPTFRVSEVAAYYSCAEQTVRLWITHGKLSTVETPGGQRRVTRESLVAWLRTLNAHRLR